MRFLGTTDEVTTCDCCGRKDLKNTVAIELDGQDVFYGVVCAARALFRTPKDIRTEAKKADDLRAAEERAVRDAEAARWFAWLAANAPGGNDVFSRIHSFPGGYAEARSLYSKMA